MAEDKCTDIIISYGNKQKLPIEVKRDFHPDLWTACENQLERLYARDPNAGGYGIYLVIWFGDKRTRNMFSPTGNVPKPASAKELEEQLCSLIPENKQHYIKAVVVDVTPPNSDP